MSTMPFTMAEVMHIMQIGYSKHEKKGKEKKGKEKKEEKRKRKRGGGGGLHLVNNITRGYIIYTRVAGRGWGGGGQETRANITMKNRIIILLEIK